MEQCYFQLDKTEPSPVPAGDVDGVAPDVVVELGGADDAGRHVPEVEAGPEDQVELDQGLVEVVHGLLQLQHEVHQLTEVLVRVGVLLHGTKEENDKKMRQTIHDEALLYLSDVGVDAAGRHEGGADSLDLLHVPELAPVQDLFGEFNKSACDFPDYFFKFPPRQSRR